VVSGRRWALASACALFVACRDRSTGERWDFERMRQQPRYDIYESSRFFLDRRAMQRPPEGTVSREQIVGRPMLTDGATNGASATSVPVPVTPQLLALGRTRFGIFCAVCHGTRADGASIVASNMRNPAPPSLLTPRARAMPPGSVYRIIRYGLGRMPSYAAELSVPERWAVVAYLSALRRREVHP
jgi:mono/diheme cytochrome c family protein